MAVPVGITDLVATMCRHGLEPEGYSVRDIARALESDERPRLTTIFDAR